MKSKRINWPDWAEPDEDAQLQLAKILLPYIKILSPEVVELIAIENNKKLEQWGNSFLDLGIRHKIYLWENCPIAFPGIRRHVGDKEVSIMSKVKEGFKCNDALLLDDNSFPKEIWSYILRGRPVDKNGPPGYSLAHVVDHKDYKSRHEKELKGFTKSEEKYLFAGLHTSCANTVWVPNNLIKPTDHNSNIRKLLIQIVQKYYSTACNVLPYGLEFNLDNIEENWKLENFSQPEIVGDVKNIQPFIDYRNKLIDDRINFLYQTKVQNLEEVNLK